MNRKLHNTILAFSVTGVMLFVGLVVAEPALPTHDGSASQPVPAIAADHHDANATSSSTGHPDNEEAPHPAQANDADAAVAIAAGVLAASVTDIVLTAVFAELEPAAERKRAERDTPARESRSKRGARASRDLIAVPYFSFARGSRGSRS